MLHVLLFGNSRVADTIEGTVLLYMGGCGLQGDNVAACVLEIVSRNV